jgi:para-nitrobenzyl esterase
VKDRIQAATRRGRQAILIAVAALALAPVAGAAVGDRGGSVIADTASGLVRGSRVGTMNEFLGVPYAEAPVGDLRWRSPQPHARWSGVRDATRFAPHCPQGASPFGVASTSEDCLFLNVLAPARAGDERVEHAPVMFWIHGGALVVGESDDYIPSMLMARGVVVVTINYRLGALGFLAHPALAAESPQGSSGNFGLLDQQAALRWVRRNISEFGGDPRNVTIFGESAGGLSIHAQLASPLAHGLFARAIDESGAYMPVQPTLAGAEAAGSAFAASAGCAGQTAACMRSLPVTTILAKQTGATTSPNVDGVVLPRTILAAFQSGNFNHVPVIEGNNHDEWRLFVAQAEVITHVPLSAAAYVPAIAATLRVPLSAATAIAAAYPLNAFSSPSVALGAVGTDAIFACNARTFTQLLARQVPTFQYEFDDPHAPMRFLPPVSFPTGAYHAAEIQYVFDLRGTPVPSPGLAADQRRLSRTMVDYWTHFAGTGSPSSEETPNWPRFGAAQQFQSLVPGTSTTATGFGTEHNCSLFGG